MDAAVGPLRDLLDKRGQSGIAEELHRLIKNVDEDKDIPGIPPKSIRGLKHFLWLLDLDRDFVNNYAHFGVWENGDLNFEMRLNAHTKKDSHFVVTGLDGNWLSFAMIVSSPESVITKEGEDTRLQINGQGMAVDVVKVLESVFRDNNLSGLLENEGEEVSPPLPKTVPLELEEKVDACMD